MRRKILVIEDDKKIARLIQEILPETEFEVKVTGNSQDFLQLLPAFQPNLAILDIHLPGISGFELCKKIKKLGGWKSLPVLMVSGAAVETRDKVRGLQTGADDYLLKPFDPSELLERVRALLRRSLDRGEPDTVLRARDIVVDLLRRSVLCGGKPIDFTPKEFDLLVTLMQEKGKVLSRSQLLKKVWGYHAEITTRTVDMHIASIRSKLGGSGKALKTEESIGYSFQDEI